MNNSQTQVIFPNTLTKRSNLTNKEEKNMVFFSVATSCRKHVYVPQLHFSRLLAVFKHTSARYGTGDKLFAKLPAAGQYKLSFFWVVIDWYVIKLPVIEHPHDAYNLANIHENKHFDVCFRCPVFPEVCLPKVNTSWYCTFHVLEKEKISTCTFCKLYLVFNDVGFQCNGPFLDQFGSF